jgi:glycerol-3-phosphate cytidylyltransferase
MSNNIIGVTAGAMNLLHAGHILMLKECKEQCDKLIVALQTDPSIDRPEKHKPVESVEERRIKLEGCRFVDLVMVYDTEEDLYNLLKTLKPDVRFLGEDHKGKSFTGDDLDIPIVYNSRNHNYSSSNLIERILQLYKN